MNDNTLVAGRPARRGRRLAALLAAAAVLAAIIVPQAGAEAAEHPDVTFTETVSDAGFTHPGIGVSAESLLNARDQVRAGVEPWASYYDAMTQTSYAETTLRSANASTVLDQPAVTAFDSAGVQSKLIADAWGAFTQAALYVITGDPVYRENGMRIIRIWSNMDPDAYAYYADAHIHSGVPLQRLLMAAEILRYSSYDGDYTAYDLAWSDDDTARLTANLIDPMTATFLYDNTHYLNQHLYPLIGAMSGYIFTDDRDRYDEGVEWFTVNSTTTRPEQNGAIAAIYPLISADDPLNSYGYDFVQHQEMGRDQAHGWDDVNTLGVLARILQVQGTRVDPEDGTASTDDDAVSAYAFLDDRLLAGANAFVGYMLGYEVPWIDTTGGVGELSDAYRGRLYNVIDEVYYVYAEQLGRDVEEEAPYIAQWHDQADAAIMHWGTDEHDFWDSNPDYAPDYWLSLPASVAGEQRTGGGTPQVQLEQRSVTLEGTTSVGADGDTGYVTAAASKRGTTIAVRTLMYPSRSGYSPVGIRYRSDSVTTLEIRGDRDAEPYETLTLPDTDGEWRTITYDVDVALIPGARIGAENLAYYTLMGKGRTTVDLDEIELDAENAYGIPAFDAGTSLEAVTVAGAETTLALGATDPDGDALSYSAIGLPKHAAIDEAAGTVTWTSRKGQKGENPFTVVVDDGTVVRTIDVTVSVGKDRKAAERLALAGYDEGTAYESASLSAVDDARAAVEDACDADDVAYLAALETLRAAVADLRELTPTLDDGTIDVRGLVTSSLSDQSIANLVDGDLNTTTGDLRAPFVLDFGEGFRVSASSFGLQARYNFANRSEGANVYGSNDGSTWTLLTSRETTNTTDQSFAMETIPVIAGLEDETWRFLKVQVDDPGVPTDPAYPGISSFSELRIGGERHETADVVSSVSLSSSNATEGLAVDGDTVTLTVVADEAVGEASAVIAGISASVSSDDGLTWTATAVVPEDVDYGVALAFAFDYLTVSGAQGSTVFSTTDGTTIELWNSRVVKADIPEAGVDASTVPWPGPGGTTRENAWRMFDGDPATYTDTLAAVSWVTATAEDAFVFDTVRILPREAYPSRANGTVVQGSNDGGETWADLVTVSGATAGAWSTFDLGADASYTTIRVYDGHDGRANIAELQLIADGR